MSISNLSLPTYWKLVVFYEPHHLDICSHHHIVLSCRERAISRIIPFCWMAGARSIWFTNNQLNYQNLDNMRKHTNIKSGRPPQWISITAHQHEEGHQYRKWLSKSFHSNLICFLNLNENGPTDRERKYAPCFLGKSKTPWLSSKVITGKPSWLWSYQRYSHHCPFSGTRALLKITKPAANVTSHWGT